MTPQDIRLELRFAKTCLAYIKANHELQTILIQTKGDRKKFGPALELAEDALFVEEKLLTFDYYSVSRAPALNIELLFQTEEERQKFINNALELGQSFIEKHREVINGTTECAA